MLARQMSVGQGAAATSGDIGRMSGDALSSGPNTGIKRDSSNYRIGHQEVLEEWCLERGLLKRLGL